MSNFLFIIILISSVTLFYFSIKDQKKKLLVILTIVFFLSIFATIIDRRINKNEAKNQIELIDSLEIVSAKHINEIEELKGYSDSLLIKSKTIQSFKIITWVDIQTKENTTIGSQKNRDGIMTGIVLTKDGQKPFYSFDSNLIFNEYQKEDNIKQLRFRYSTHFDQIIGNPIEKLTDLNFLHYNYSILFKNNRYNLKSNIGTIEFEFIINGIPVAKFKRRVVDITKFDSIDISDILENIETVYIKKTNEKIYE